MKILVTLFLLVQIACWSHADLPINVKANSLQVNYDRNVAEYKGNVRAVQGDLKINSDNMTVFYKGKSGDSISDKAALDSIAFDRNVKIRQGEDVATGDNAIYREKDKKIFLTGNVTLMHGKNIMKGKTVIYDTDKKFFSVTNNTKKQKKRVRAIIFDN